MYTRAFKSSVKELMSLFRDIQPKLRVLIATTAFSMGIDIPDICQVYHWGASSDLEQYLQEIGRAGRDGKAAKAVLIINSKGYRYVKKPMKAYCENMDNCRHKELLSFFIVYEHTAAIKCTCDIWSLSCTCKECKMSD